MRIGEGAEVFEITVTDDAPIAGKTLNEAAMQNILAEDILVVAIERDGVDHPITPRGNTTIQEGDLLTVYSGVGADPEITAIFGHSEDRAQ
jgi:trk system potassium uptake protein TrkA